MRTERGVSVVVSIVLIIALVTSLTGVSYLLTTSAVAGTASVAPATGPVVPASLPEVASQSAPSQSAPAATEALDGTLDNSGASAHPSTDERSQNISFSVSFDEPQLKVDNGYDMIEIAGCGSFASSPGAPTVPKKTITILLPPDRNVSSIRITSLGSQPVSKKVYLYPGQEQVPLSMLENARFTPPAQEIYSSSSSYPGQLGRLESVTIDRGYRLAVVTLFPVTYVPSERTAICHSKLKVNIQLTDAVDARDMTTVKPKIEDAEKIAEQVVNPEMVDVYSQTLSGTSGGEESSLSTLLLSDPSPHEYVIITNNILKDSGAWQPLIDRKNAKDLNATIVTTEWIYSNYGGVDNPEQIRNFIIDAYNNWETKWVLLGGYSGIVPPRMFWVEAWPGCSDDYKTNMPSDMYYSCLDGDFNYDGDDLWAEPNDGPGGGEVDLYAEVYVGRAAVENSTEVQNFVRKTLAYEDFAPSSTYLAYMLGEKMGWGGVSEYATASMEEIRLGSREHGYTTTGFATSNEFTTNTLYDEPGYDWSISKLIYIINSGVDVLNHEGHADYTYDMKLYTSDLVSLNNTQYFFAYSQGCMPGGFDTTNCFAEEITSMYYGAAAVVMNARYGWGLSYSTDGPSQWFDRQFWDAAFGEDIYNLGKMNSDSKEDTILIRYNQDCWRWCYYELNLFGDPELGVAKVNRIITTVEELQAMNDDLSASYVLGNDIDASGTRTWNPNGTGGYYGFEPIGSSTSPFTGSFDGRGYKIENLYINRPDNDYVGLFGYVESGGVVKNVGLEDADISGLYEVGGLVGFNRGGAVSNSYSTGSVSGDWGVGGLIGFNYYVTVNNCYSSGSVSGIECVGGLVGVNYGTVNNCYSTGTVSGDSEIGGLVGVNDGNGLVSNSFYDTNTSGQSDTGKGTPKTTEDMQNVQTFTDPTWSAGLTSPWDFVDNPYYDTGNEDIWGIHPEINDGYPFLTALMGAPPFSGGGDGTPENPYVITTVNQLREIKNYLDACFILGNDIYAYDTINWNEGAGFVPIGTFTGNFDGRGYKIINLFINRPYMDYVGFFGSVGNGVVKNVGMESVNVTGDRYVGGLVGCNVGTVENSHSEGSVIGNAYRIGGLVGFNGGTVSKSCSTCSVEGIFDVGGLIGRDYGTVTNCYSMGLVSGFDSVGGLVGHKAGGIVSNCYSTEYVNGSEWFIGGLVGYNYGGIVSNCYSTGSVSDGDFVGGLVGYNDWGAVDNCYSTGSVDNSGEYIGGLMGSNYYGTVSNCYSTGSVSGSWEVGGLAGCNNGGTISNCYSTGSVSGSDRFIGGLVGWNLGTISNCYSIGSVSGFEYVGGLVGYNTGTVSNCYSIGSVSSDYYHYTGGLIGHNEGIVTNSFWDMQRSGLGISDGGVGKTCIQMTNVRTFTDTTWSAGLTSPWDFVGNPCEDMGNEDIWNINPTVNRGYPFLTYTIPPFSGSGSGTLEDPYIITTFEQLQEMGYYLTAHYALGNDIDAGYFSPIGNDINLPFNGSLDGQGHVISNLHIESDLDGVGLFGYIGSSGVVKNLGLEDVDLYPFYYCDMWGALAGVNYGLVMNCYTTGSMEYCGVTNFVGGLVGYNDTDGQIIDCYSTVTVSGKNYVGGLVGYFSFDEGPNIGEISNCYSTGVVSGNNYVGGLVGYEDYHVNRVHNSFWDIDTSGQPIYQDSKGTGKSTNEMKDVATFTHEWNEETEEGSVGLDKAWDFVGHPYDDGGDEDIWDINPATNNGYPFLTAFPQKTSVTLTPTEDGYIHFGEGGGGRNNTGDSIKMGYFDYEVCRGYVEWDISAIPDDATITKVALKYHGALHQGTDARIADLLGVRPSESSDELLFSAIAQDDYIFVEDGFPEIGANKEVDLGSLGVEILQIYLDDQCDWFAVGLMAVSESYPNLWSEIYSSDYAWATPKPTLYVEYLPHDRIYIVGNEDFTAVNGVTGGSGTESDPYIIENRVISASSANGIDIRDTTAYFVVRNCVVENGGDTYNGIYLNNVINGRIESNTCSNNNSGILLSSSSYDNLTNNTCSNNNANGIYLSSSSDYNILENNTCSNNGGVGLPVSSYPIIAAGNASVTINGTHAADYWKGCYASVNGQVRRITMSYDTGGGGTYLAVDAWWNPKPTSSDYVSVWGKAQIMQLGNNAEGIYLHGSSYNNLDNNTCEGNWDCGIYLEFSSDNNLITSNTCSNNDYGIALVSSSDCNIDNNICEFNSRYDNPQYGIYLDSSSDNNTLIGNTVSATRAELVACICLEESDYNILGNNILLEESKYGVYLKSSGYNLLENNAVESGGYSCIFLENSENNTLENNTANSGHGVSCPIYLLNSDYNNLTNNITGGSDDGGIQLRYSDYNVLDGNSTGGAESIILTGSNYNTVRNNSAGGSWIGIELTGSNNNTIDNNISKNHWLGIQLSSSSNNNLIFHNNIINNTTQARDDGSNYWDDGYPSGGNYWSDWQPPEHPDANDDGIVDEPRPIAGGGNQDNYPLVQVS